MKPGVILINVGRGDLIDPAVLVEALQQKHIAAAALDVFDPEPLPADSPLLRMDNVIVSSHVASVSVKAVRKLRESVAQDGGPRHPRGAVAQCGQWSPFRKNTQ